MPKYIVTTREVWTQGWEVEADNAEEAKRKVACDEGVKREGLFEFSHFMGENEWTVEEIEGRDEESTDTSVYRS